jgi:hypothetical protein
LYGVLIPAPLDSAFHELWRELAVLRAHGQELHPGDRLRGAAFIDVQMRRIGTDHRLPSTARRAQRQHVGGRPVEDDKRPRAVAEMLCEQLLDGPRPVVVAVAERMTAIGGGQRLEHGRMDPG